MKRLFKSMLLCTLYVGLSVSVANAQVTKTSTTSLKIDSDKKLGLKTGTNDIKAAAPTTNIKIGDKGTNNLKAATNPAPAKSKAKVPSDIQELVKANKKLIFEKVLKVVAGGIRLFPIGDDGEGDAEDATCRNCGGTIGRDVCAGFISTSGSPFGGCHFSHDECGDAGITCNCTTHTECDLETGETVAVVDTIDTGSCACGSTPREPDTGGGGTGALQTQSAF